MKVRIKAISQISTCEPLTDSWFTDPKPCTEIYNRSVEASYAGMIPASVSRRMGLLLKRASATSIDVLAKGGVDMPQAVICGTGLGCIESTEKFLTAMVFGGEECLQPTSFINSTHNTVASQIATLIHCHGYNNTFAHLGISFESALLDALMQFEAGRISSAVVSGHDEMTPTYFSLFEKVGYWKKTLGGGSLASSLDTEGTIAGECAGALLLQSDGSPEGHCVSCDSPSGNVSSGSDGSGSDGSGNVSSDSAGTSDGECFLSDVALCHSEDISFVKSRLESFLSRNSIVPEDIDLVMTGRNGDVRFDSDYDALVEGVFGDGMAQGWYKHVFGESFSAGVFGVMVGARSLRESFIPQTYIFSGRHPSRLQNILVINSFRSCDRAFTLLRK